MVAGLFAAFSGKVAAVDFLSTLPNGLVGQPYSQALVPNGVAPIVCTDDFYSPMPDGLAIVDGGIIVGTPTTAGTYTMNIKCIDANTTDGGGTHSVTLVIDSAVINTDKVVRGQGKITLVATDYIVVKGTTIYITPETKIKLNKAKKLKVGQTVKYKGKLNSDGTITAKRIKVKN